MLIDTHCHINSLSQPQRDEFLSSLPRDMIFIDSSTNYQTTEESLAISRKHASIYTAVGFHPFWAKEYHTGLPAEYEALIAGNKKVIAIGEIGLDYKAEVSLAEQETILREFIKLADKKKIPVMIHNRTEDFRILDILDDFFACYDKVLFHCFSYGEEVLDKVIKKGAFVSFSLNVLRKKKDVISSLNKCPLDRILLETDSPYMRIDGRPSTPLDIEKVYSFAAKVKSITRKDLEEAVYANSRRIFQIL